MNVDEALTIAEMVLDEAEPLNDVQELIFRECWQGRRSYEAIADVSGYEKEYLKSIGAKLWQQLSDAFGEKVKKSNLRAVIRRYAQQHHLKQRNLVIEVNLSGADLSGANLSNARLFANLSEADLGQADLNENIHPDPDTKSDEEYDREIQSNCNPSNYEWNGWEFASEAEVKIAEALDRFEVLFFPNAQGRFSTASNGRENSDRGFLICHQGKWGFFVVQESRSPDNVDRNVMPDDERSPLVESPGIQLIADYDATDCLEDSDRIVQNFFDRLSDA